MSDDWQIVTLGAVLPFRYGKGLPERNRAKDGRFRVVSSAGVSGRHSTAITSGPAVVIGRKGSIGTVYFCPDPVFPIDTTFYVEESKVINIRFAYYLLRTLPLSKMNNDSAVPGLNRSQAEALEVSLPPLAEQRGIAATLGALDDKIESNRRAIRGINDLLDAKAFQLGSELPTVALGDLVGSTTETVDPLRLGQQVVDHYSIPAFDSMHMPERIAASKIMSNKLAISETCILISRLNPHVNRTWLAIPEPGFPSMASTEFLCVLPRGRVELGAMWLAVRDKSFISELRRRVTGTSGSHQRVRPTDALAIEVPDVGKLDEAEKLKATALLEIAHQKQVESQRLSQLRDALVPELLSGRIRVPEAQGAAEAFV